ncbi:hypothetical protein VSDG_03840 [Cytospora chrysosperma]|uniref:Zn(2)-C6 fungal-type domain-containing protein n=1 Tax=Cytospora chrysosperma TaxID=252740 RepID=A0A423W6J4_CYTCH|nr:hypothetical protein VSDG_03840 [Valsa sordida]
MVGVPGKYKGCNTCRMRRVKCDNERPFCKKCVDSGRECLGYERETVFIVGTVEDKGRCSSHPPRNSKGTKKSPSPPRTSEGKAPESRLVPVKPLQPAWSDQIPISSAGATRRFQVAALCTPLSAVARGHHGGKSETTVLSLPPYTPIDVRPTFGDADFELHAQCLVHVSPAKDDDPAFAVPESVVLFLYEQNCSLASSSLPPWLDPVAQQNRIRQLGPEHFRTFPSHHFFARTYRPSAITTALLNRKGTFCADPEWTTVPFELHHKCLFDRLLDLMAQAPALLQRLDQLLILDPTLARRLVAQDLLGNCLNLQAQLEQWFSAALSFSGSEPLYWVDPQEDGEIPFSGTFSFQDPLTSLSLTYYWSVQALMLPCIELLVHSIFSPVVDVYPPVFPDLPPQLNVDPDNYGPRVVREVAANVCRALDYVLATTTQPDMLAFPVQVVETFYGALSVQAGDGALELMWLASFRGRMAMRGQGLAELVNGRVWTDLAAW